MPAEDNFDFLFKIVLIGDCGTGKTCVVQRFKSGTYAENQGNTIGVDFSMKTIKIDGKKVKVRVFWFVFGAGRKVPVQPRFKLCPSSLGSTTKVVSREGSELFDFRAFVARNKLDPTKTGSRTVSVVLIVDRN